MSVSNPDFCVRCLVLEHDQNRKLFPIRRDSPSCDCSCHLPERLRLDTMWVVL